ALRSARGRGGAQKEDPMMQLKSRTLVDAMHEEDIPEVQAIERQILPTPWPRNAYYRELHHNRSAYYLVLRRDEEIVGYAGLWKMSDEAHITTVGVRANQQGKGYGHALMAALIQRAYHLGSRWLTLEVLLSNVVRSQDELHAPFGGVVPEISARAHLQTLIPVIERALETAGTRWEQVDGVAVTRGPGLVGCLLVGVNVAQAIAWARKLPVVGVSHLAAHVFAAQRETPELRPPLLGVVVSGG